MKNPFEKENQPGLIVLLSVAAVAAGVVSYLYLTEKGADTRKVLKHKLKDEAKDFASGFISGKTGISKNTVKKVADHIVK